MTISIEQLAAWIGTHGVTAYVDEAKECVMVLDEWTDAFGVAGSEWKRVYTIGQARAFLGY